MNAELDAYPDARKALLDDRNARWALQIETMLTEKRTFFITVGVPALQNGALVIIELTLVTLGCALALSGAVVFVMTL